MGLNPTHPRTLSGGGSGRAVVGGGGTKSSLWARSARQAHVHPGPRPPCPDLLSRERHHVQGPVHEASVQHLGAALAHDRVACPVVRSDILAGGDGVSPQPSPDRDAGGAVVGDPRPGRGEAQVVGAFPTRPEVGGACKLRLPGDGAVTGRDSEGK